MIVDDLTRCDACNQEHPGPADEWGVYGAPNGSRGTRERLLCPQCASAVTSLFGSRGARIEAARSPASVTSRALNKAKKPRAAARRSGTKARGAKKR